MDRLTLYALPLVLVAILALVVALFVWRRRQAPGAHALLALLATATVWALAYAVELTASDQATKVLFAKIEYLGIALLPLAWLAFGFQYTGRGRWLTPLRVGLLAIVPAVTLVLVWTNGAHELIWQETSLEPVGDVLTLRVVHGSWFWVYASFAYGMLLVGSIPLVRVLLRSLHLYQKQSAALLIAIVIPWLANGLYLSGVNPVPGLDLTPFAFPLTGILLTWNLYHLRLLDIVPVARDVSVQEMRDGIIVLDRQGRVVDINPAAEQIVGSKAETLLGQTLGQAIPGQKTLIERIHQRDDVGDPIEMTLGEGVDRREYELAISRLQDQRDAHSGHLIVFRDITERKRADDERSQLLARELAAHAEADAARKNLAFLAEASRVLASSLDYEVTLQSVVQLAVPRLADICSIDLARDNGSVERLAAASSQPTPAAETTSSSPEATSLVTFAAIQDVVSSGRPVLNPAQGAQSEADRGAGRSTMIVPLLARGRALGAITFVSAESRRYSLADLPLAEDLAHRAAQAIDNALLYHYAQKATRIREEFISTASHELKTPLTTIKGYAQVLSRQLNRLEGDLGPVSGTMSRLHTEIARFEKLVQDLLDLSRIQQGRLDLRPERFNLVDLARDVFQRFEQVAALTGEHELIFDAPESVIVVWDRARMDQVFTNLLSNALKYSPEPGSIRFEIASREGYAEITVRDQGIGITAEERAILFLPFERGDRAWLLTAGTGLGLFIASRIVEQHGGTITVESEPDAGSTFKIRLPLTFGGGVGNQASLVTRELNAEGSSPPLTRAALDLVSSH